MYSIVWKYKINPEFKDKFESEYGPNGQWAKLFNSSKHYRGSVLHTNVEDQNFYLLIDRWSSQENYEHFLRTHESAYQEMSVAMEHLYEVEEKIGGFNSLTN